MNLNFNIDYKTAFGEEIVLNLVSSDCEGEKETAECQMSTFDGERWTCSLHKVLQAGTFLDYYYSVKRDGRTVRLEWTLETHRLELVARKGESYTIYDHWIDIPDNAYLYSSAFTDCINRREHIDPQKTSYLRTARLKVRAPQLRRHEHLAVIGSDPSLGGWSPLDAVPMVEHNYNEWIVDIDISRLNGNLLEFKFVVLDEDVDVSPIWELGDNRYIVLPEMSNNEVVVYELPEARFDLYNIKCAGTLVPVFSLRSETSFGVGDFGDLRKMVDWV